jgi:hypothetical protein
MRSDGAWWLLRQPLLRRPHRRPRLRLRSRRLLLPPLRPSPRLHRRRRRHQRRLQVRCRSVADLPVDGPFGVHDMLGGRPRDRLVRLRPLVLLTVVRWHWQDSSSSSRTDHDNVIARHRTLQLSRLLFIVVVIVGVGASTLSLTRCVSRFVRIPVNVSHTLAPLATSLSDSEP